MLFTRREPTGKPEMHVLSGENFTEFVLQVPIDLDAKEASDYESVLGTRLGRSVLYVADGAAEAATAGVVPLVYMP